MDARVATMPRRERLTDQVYHNLSGMILKLELTAGTPLIEERLAEQMNVSRTPLREAIQRLAAERLITKVGNRSFAVRTVTAQEFFQSHKVRELLEAEAVELAMGRVSPQTISDLKSQIQRLAEYETQELMHWDADNAVHLTFAEASGNQVLLETIKQLRITTRLFEVSQPLLRVKRDAAEHLAILDAFEDGDVKRARKAMVKHIQGLVTDTLKVLRSAA